MAGSFEVGRNSVVIDAPAQQVFDYLADLSHIVEWSGEPDFRISGDPDRQQVGQGASLQREMSGIMRGPLIVSGGMSDNPLRVVKITTVTVFEPHAALAVETRNSYNGLLHSVEKFSFQFSTDGSGTLVSLVSEVQPMVPGMFIGPVYAIRVVRAAFGRIFGGRLAGIFSQTSAGPHLTRIKETVEALRVPSS